MLGSMTFPTKLEAVDFFAQLRRFTKRAIDKAIPGTPLVSPHTSGWKRGAASGAILHYTASGGWQGPVRWFADPAAKASAHVVVSDKLEAALVGLADDLPLVKALPVTVIQCVGPDQAAWHATWTNGLCYGIENRNTGLVKRDNPSAPWRHWPKAKGATDEWTSLAPVIPGKSYVAVTDTEGYEPYTKAQLIANVMLLRYVGALRGSPLDPHFVLPHSAVQSNKWDTGPLFPIHEIRRLACIATTEDPAAALSSFNDPADKTSADDLDAPAAPGDNRGTALTEAEREATEVSIHQLRAVEGDVAPKQHPFSHLARPLLDKLGFFVPTPKDPRDLDVWLRRALWIYQTGAKLNATSEPDDATRAALAARVAALGLG